MRPFCRIMPVRGIFSMLMLLASVFPAYSQRYFQTSLENLIEQRRVFIDTAIFLMSKLHGCELTCPQGWTKEIFTIGFDRNYEDIVFPASYRFVSPQRDVIVTYSIYGAKEDSVKSGRSLGDWVDVSYGRQPIQYSQEYTKNFGADYGGQYPKARKYFCPSLPIHDVRNTDKFSQCETVWFYKHRWVVELDFFYKPGTDIDKYIKEVAGGIVHFKEGFTPPPPRQIDESSNKSGGKITFRKQE